VAAFDSHKDGDAAAFPGAEDFICGRSEKEIVRMAGGFAADGVDLRERAANGFGGSVEGGIDKDRHEDSANVAGTHAGDIDLAEGVAFGEVIAFVENHLGSVVVKVRSSRRATRTELRRSGAGDGQ
jgi:hypothetical protein